MSEIKKVKFEIVFDASGQGLDGEDAADMQGLLEKYVEMAFEDDDMPPLNSYVIKEVTE